MAKTQLTDAQIKSKIIANAQNAPAKAEQSLFPTEIVPLPSKGLVYSKDNPLSSGEVEVRYMTAKDEDILTNQNYLKKGIALDKLYESIVVGNGQGQPVDINEMIIGDRSAIMLAARVLGYGSDYTIEVEHPVTGKKFPYTVDLNQLKPLPIDESLYNNSREFEFELPISKKVVVFKLQTARDSKTINRKIEAIEKAGGNQRNTTTMLKEVIVSVDGNSEQQFINDFVDNYLLAKDSLLLRKQILDLTPDYDLTVQVNAPEEDYQGEVIMPIDLQFFWPRL